MAIVGPTLLGSGFSGSESVTGAISQSLVFQCDEFSEVLVCGPASWEGIPRKRGGRAWQKDRDRAGKYVVTVAYEGMPPVTQELERWRWVPTKTDEPIEANPWIEQLAAKFSGDEQDDGSIFFTRYLASATDAASTDGLQNLNKSADGRVKNPMFGLDTYIKKSLIVRLTFRYRNFPQRTVELDGTVIDKLPYAKWDLWPDRDWLVWVGEIDEQGEGDDIFYEGTVDYVLSQPNGWPPLYWLIDRLQ